MNSVTTWYHRATQAPAELAGEARSSWLMAVARVVRARWSTRSLW